MSEQANPELVRLGNRIVKLTAIASTHWEGERLFVYLDGGRFLQLGGDDAKRLWAVMQERSVSLRTGEVG